MDAVHAAIVTLALDEATVEAVEALDHAGVPSILLKGRSFADWLYGHDEFRPYNDVDLLVPTRQWRTASDVLTTLGYVKYVPARHDPPHASAYVRGADGMVIDLHRTLQGLTAPWQHVWDALAGHTAITRIGQTEIVELDEPGRCLAVALHAGRSDATGLRARDDLRRAIEVADPGVWRAAMGLAETVGGAAAFATGLASNDEGQQLAASISASAVPPPADSPLRGSNTLARAIAADSLQDSLRQLLPWLVPSRGLLLQTRPIARRGRLGVVIGYATWPVWLLVQLARASAHRLRR